MSAMNKTFAIKVLKKAKLLNTGKYIWEIPEYYNKAKNIAIDVLENKDIDLNKYNKATISQAITILKRAKTAPIDCIPGNPIRHNSQNQTFYDAARNLVVKALQEYKAKCNLY